MFIRGRGSKLKHLERPGWKYSEWSRGGGQQEIQCSHLKMVTSSLLQFCRPEPKSTGFPGFLNKRARNLFFIFLKFQNEGNWLKMSPTRPNRHLAHMILSLSSRCIVKPIVYRHILVAQEIFKKWLGEINKSNLRYTISVCSPICMHTHIHMHVHTHMHAHIWPITPAVAF